MQSTSAKWAWRGPTGGLGWGLPFSILGLWPNLECSREVCEPKAVLNPRLKLINICLLIGTASATILITILSLYASMVNTQTVIY